MHVPVSTTFRLKEGGAGGVWVDKNVLDLQYLTPIQHCVPISLVCAMRGCSPVEFETTVSDVVISPGTSLDNVYVLIDVHDSLHALLHTLQSLVNNIQFIIR